MADQERQIEQAKNTAKYQKMMTTVMFPYEQWARIAQNAASAGTFKYMQEGGPSGLSSIQSAVGSIGSIVGSVGGMLKPSGQSGQSLAPSMNPNNSEWSGDETYGSST
jgi:hypothetical protein